MAGEINMQSLLSCGRSPASLSVTNNIVLDQTGSRVFMQYQTVTTTAVQVSFNIGNAGCFFAKNIDATVIILLALSNDFSGTSTSMFCMLLPGCSCLVPFPQTAKGAL